MAIHVRFWGTRGSIPTPGSRTRRYGGNTACIEIRHGETLIICDAGSGIRELGVDLLRRGGPIEAHLLFTHTHWDHIQGFPFFTPAYLPGSRFHIYDEEETQGRFYSLLSGQMQSSYFPVQFADLKSQFIPQVIRNHAVKIGMLDVRTHDQDHPGGSLAYAFTSAEAKVVYATDNEFDRLTVTTSGGAGGKGETGGKGGAGGKGETGGGLRRFEPGVLEFLQDADLLIADAQFTDAEYPTRHGWGHASCFTTTDLAIQAGVKRLALFHHDPARSDAALDELAAACSARATAFGSDLQIFPAREGVELREPAMR